MPRFGPKDRCSIHPVYKPAVPGYEPPRSSKAADGKEPGEHDGGHSPPSDKDDDSSDQPEPDQGQEDGDNEDEEQIGQDYSQNATQPPRGAPPPAIVQQKAPQRGDPWQVLRYDRAIWQEQAVTDHTQMSSDMKRQVNWAMAGLGRPGGTKYRGWDDELEEQNPWHQGGRPVLKQ